jgi:hypothetical protein
VVSVKDSYGHILGFLDWSHYFFFEVAPQFTHEAEWTQFIISTKGQITIILSIPGKNLGWETTYSEAFNVCLTLSIILF